MGGGRDAERAELHLELGLVVGVVADGRVRVLSSEDGRQWQSETLIEVVVPGQAPRVYDLRDPKLSTTADGGSSWQTAHTVVLKAIEELVALFAGYDEAGPLAMGEEAVETARALVFLEKWEGQLRAAWAQAGCW